MKIEISPVKWQVRGSLISFPYGWQRPAKTEEWVFEAIKNYRLDSPYVEYICFPWATLVDLISREKKERIKFYLDAINCAPKKKGLIRVTVLQHINIDPLIEIFEQLKIDHVFWAHKRIEENFRDNVSLSSLPLYPWAYFNKGNTLIKPPDKREFFMSFIGASTPEYMTDIRERLFDLKISNSYLRRRVEWHFEGEVYGAQIHGTPPSNFYLEKKENEAKEYIKVLSETKISLCPAGMGPNTIRYWESLAFGCIPLLFSDFFDRPKISSRWVDIRVPEIEFSSSIENLNSTWNVISKNFHDKNPILDFNEITTDWLKESVFDVFVNENIRSIYRNSFR